MKTVQIKDITVGGGKGLFVLAGDKGDCLCSVYVFFVPRTAHNVLKSRIGRRLRHSAQCGCNLYKLLSCNRLLRCKLLVTDTVYYAFVIQSHYVLLCPVKVCKVCKYLLFYGVNHSAATSGRRRSFLSSATAAGAAGAPIGAVFAVVLLFCPEFVFYLKCFKVRI